MLLDLSLVISKFDNMKWCGTGKRNRGMVVVVVVVGGGEKQKQKQRPNKNNHILLRDNSHYTRHL